jgi:hypothetical protein
MPIPPQILQPEDMDTINCQGIHQANGFPGRLPNEAGLIAAASTRVLLRPIASALPGTRLRPPPPQG